ncbi:hypothetical protein [Companilactobacillus insicii]|uniref:hypothetical protein n=1 Tax=Companilactobacillus insicii TaxID=1732567 RepID=UPI000F7AF140|nr:hypothetical protein [Companilactobacillus insicii]
MTKEKDFDVESNNDKKEKSEEKDLTEKSKKTVDTEKKPLLNDDWQERLDKAKKILKKIIERKYPIILITITTVIIMFTMYMIGVSHYSRERQLDTLASNITSGVPSKMSKVLVTPNKERISEKELEPLQKLQASDEKTNGQIKTIVEHESSYSNFRVIKVGKYWGIYPKYKIELRKRNIVVETNINNPIFKINNKIYKAKRNGTEYYLIKSIPGSYPVKVSNKSGSYNKTRTVVVPVSGTCNETNIDITMRRSPAI